MLYWLPRAAASSPRLYWESLGDVTRWLEGPLQSDDRIHAPTGATIFAHELQRPARDAASARVTDIRYWSTPATGGHFPALEQPETFATELSSFFALVR
jgi:pimeloyl-ACP methyl ester carboxylesterase